MSSYVQVITPQKLEQTQIKNWFECVQNNIPSGMIGQTPLYADDETRMTRFYTKPTKNGKFAYVVPLVRDLDLSEAHAIVKNWCECFPQGDFLIDYSQPIKMVVQSNNKLEQEKIQSVIDQWSKQEHQDWMQNLIEQGWRYGTTLSSKNKTHPWLQPWEQLPQAAQEQKTKSVISLVNTLKKFGYHIAQIAQG